MEDLESVLDLDVPAQGGQGGPELAFGQPARSQRLREGGQGAQGGQGTIKLRLLCNFDAEAIYIAYRRRGVVFATSMEQSQKTIFLAVLALLSMMMERPCTIIAGLSLSSTGDLENKMAETLAGMGVKTELLSNAEGMWRRFKGDDMRVDEFLTGRRVVVTPSYYAMARTEFLDEVDARNMLMLLDESDNAFSRDHFRPGSKEETFAAMIGRPHEPDSRVTGLVLVSATHLADFHLWCKAFADVPRHFIAMDIELLRARGYTTHREMDLFDAVNVSGLQPETISIR